jgi:excisionase family DNA binding protein
MMDEHLLSPAQIAQRLQVSQYTAVKWMRQGRIPGARKLGKFWRLRPADLEAFINQPARSTRVKLPVAVAEPPTAQHCTQTREALVALLTLLFREGQPVYLRRRYGWTTFPLALVNRVLEPAYLLIHASKTRKAEQAIACLDTYGNVERYGLFELRRLPQGET